MPRAWEMTKGGIAFRVGNEGAGRGLWVTMRGASGAHKEGGRHLLEKVFFTFEF